MTRLKKTATITGILVIVAITVAVLLFPRTPAALLEGHIITTTGDRISGELPRIGEGVAYIRTPLMQEELEIPLQDVRNVYFAAKPPIDAAGKDSVIFPGGEKLSGYLVSMNSKTVTLATSCCGRLDIRRDVVEALVLEGGPGLISTDDYTLQPGGYRQVYNVDCLGAEVEQDGHMIYEWKMKPEKDRMNSDFRFFCNARTCQDSYAIIVTKSPEEGSIELARVDGYYTKTLASCTIKDDLDEVNLKVSYDSETGKIRVWANSESPLIYYREASPRRSGKYIRIAPQLQFHRKAAVSSVRVTRRACYQPEARMEDEEGDVFCHIESGTRLCGYVEWIDSERIWLRTDDGRSELDRGERVVILFDTRSIARPERKPGSVELTLHNLDRLALDIDRFERDVVSGESPYTGRISINRSAVREVDFSMGRR